jgi:hypothetical protein
MPVAASGFKFGPDQRRGHPLVEPGSADFRKTAVLNGDVQPLIDEGLQAHVMRREALDVALAG